ncbi:hypothetical protein GE21DRAFT_1290048, partial [Neurospora crassa]
MQDIEKRQTTGQSPPVSTYLLSADCDVSQRHGTYLPTYLPTSKYLYPSRPTIYINHEDSINTTTSMISLHAVPPRTPQVTNATKGEY